MITRIWHGQTRPEHADSYLAFLLNEGTREYLQTEGNLSAKVWRNKEAAFCDFWTVTEWKDTEAIKKFAGDAYEKARYYPADAGILLEFEKNVNHYECFDVSATRVRDYIRQLTQLYEGGSWQAESFVEKIRDVDEEQAFEQPVPGVHSIAEILWHCIYWRTVLINRIRGNDAFRDETVENQNFLPADELKNRGWVTLKREFEGTQQILIEYLQQHNDQVLTKQYQSGFTIGYHLEGIIQHDIYHLGQIGLVKKILLVGYGGLQMQKQ